MTPGDALEPAVLTGAATARHVVDVGGIPMSALILAAPRPRAVIVALHGGAAMSAYFDAPNRPRLSLLRTGAALGFTVIALDRPGYGSSAPYADEMAYVQRRVDLAYAAVGRLLKARAQGAGVFVLGHSMGCALAVQMAGDERGADLLGLEIAGIGRHHHADAAAVLGARMLRGPGQVVAEEQAGGGHNLSLGLSAMAYHLKVLSFAEECVLARENTDSTSRDNQVGAAEAPIELAGG
jgi:pimeloyl-ACP methyl ester carboxylesterase